MRKTHLDTDEFWVIGDFLGKVFAKWGGDGHGCYIDSSDPAEAERFDSYFEAQNYCYHDGEVLEWKEVAEGPEGREAFAVQGPGGRVRAWNETLVHRAGGRSAPESPRGGRFRDNKTATQLERGAL